MTTLITPSVALVAPFQTWHDLTELEVLPLAVSDEIWNELTKAPGLSPRLVLCSESAEIVEEMANEFHWPMRREGVA